MPCTFLMLLSVAAAAVPSNDAVAAGSVADAEVHEIFVPEGDILDIVPEFVAQLGLPAISVDLGLLLSRGVPIEGRPHSADVTHVRPERTVRAFEQARGTVRETLDAFCRRNPSFSWHMDAGLVSLVYRAAESPFLPTFLDARLERFAVSQQPLAKASFALEKAAEDALSLPDIPGRQRWEMHSQREYPSKLLTPRCLLDRPVTVDLKAVTVRQVLQEFVRLQPNGVLLIYDEDDYYESQDKSKRQAHIVLTCLSPERERLDLDTLVRCLASTYEPLHGYAAIYLRVDDAKRELSRRYHFHPAEVGRALMQPHGMPHIIKHASTGEMKSLTLWLYLLDDPDLSEQTRELVLALKDPDRRYKGTLMFDNEKTKDRVLPLWTRLADDADPRVAAHARQVLKWWAEASGAGE